MAGPWILVIELPDSVSSCEVEIPFPKNLSVTGLKNLLQEKASLPSPSLWRITFTDEATAIEGELHETSEKHGAMFLRDYPLIRNGCKLRVVSQ